MSFTKFLKFHFGELKTTEICLLKQINDELFKAVFLRIFSSMRIFSWINFHLFLFYRLQLPSCWNVLESFCVNVVISCETFKLVMPSCGYELLIEAYFYKDGRFVQLNHGKLIKNEKSRHIYFTVQFIKIKLTTINNTVGKFNWKCFNCRAVWWSHEKGMMEGWFWFVLISMPQSKQHMPPTFSWEHQLCNPIVL